MREFLRLYYSVTLIFFFLIAQIHLCEESFTCQDYFFKPSLIGKGLSVKTGCKTALTHMTHFYVNIVNLENSYLFTYPVHIEQLYHSFFFFFCFSIRFSGYILSSLAATCFTNLTS